MPTIGQGNDMPEDTTAATTRETVLPIGRNIMRAMVPAENSIDEAIAGTSTLLAHVAAGRARSGVGVDVGANVMHSIWRGLGALLQARDEIVAGHGQLAAVRDALNMEPEEFGCSASKLTARRRPAAQIA